MSTNTPVTGPDPAAQAAAQAAAERQRLAAEEAKRAADAAKEAQGTGNEPVYFDKQGALDRDTVAKDDPDLMAGYAKYAQADGSIKEEDFERLYAEVHVAAADPRSPQDVAHEAFRLGTQAQDAQSDQDRLDEQLKAELDQMGGTVSPQQKADYEAAWKDKYHYADVAKKATDAQDSLNCFLSDPTTQAKMREGLANGTANAQWITGALATAAKGPNPKGVVDFVSGLMSDPAVAGSTHLDGTTLQGLVEGPVAQATKQLAAAAAAQAAKEGKPTDQAVAAVYQQVADQLGAAGKQLEAALDAREQAEGGNPGEDLRGKRDAQKALTTAGTVFSKIGTAVRAGKGELMTVLGEAAALDVSPGLKKALIGAGAVAGVLSIKSALDKRDYDEMLRQGILSAPDFADLTSEAAKGVSRMLGEDEGFGGFALTGEAFAKVSGVANGLAGLVGAAMDFNAAATNHDGYKVAAGVGNLLVSIGGFTSVANPAAGAVLMGAGVVVNTAANYFDERAKHDSLIADLDLLSTLPGDHRVNNETIAWLKAADPKGQDAGNVVDGLGLAGTDFQQFLHDHPEYVDVLHGSPLQHYVDFVNANYATAPGQVDRTAAVATLLNVPTYQGGGNSARDRQRSVQAFMNVVDQAGPAIAKDPDHTQAVKPNDVSNSSYAGQYIQYLQNQTRAVQARPAAGT